MAFMTNEEYVELDSQLLEIKQYLLKQLREGGRNSSTLFRVRLKHALDKITKAIAEGQFETSCDPQTCCQRHR